MWFQTEVLSSRIFSSIVWHLVLQLVITEALLFTYQVISWYPLVGIHAWLSRLFSGISIVYHSSLILMSVSFAALHVRNYSVQQHIPLTRLQALWTYLHPQRIIHMVTLALFSCLMMFCYTQLIGGEIANLQEECHGDCSMSGINGNHLFVLLYGVYAGSVYSLKYFMNGWYLVIFPVIQQMKFLTVKSRIKEIFMNSIVQVLRSLHWYYALYFLFGTYPKKWLSVVIGVKNSSSTSFNEVFNLGLLLITVGCGTALHFVWSLYFCLFNTYVTERHEFVIKADLESEKEKVLSKALSSNPGILRCLAFLDLRFLTENSPSRRALLFSISQPGGHPYHWEAISSFCLSTLEEFLCKLNELSTIVLTSAVKTPAAQTPLMGTPLTASQLPLSSSFSSSSFVRHTVPYGMTLSPVSKPVPITDSVGVANYLLTSLKKIQEALRRKPIVAYFLNDLPSARARKLFSCCQPIIWMIEALSFVISASYKEDRYGVVQQSFPKILCLLMDLKLAEEKLQLGTISVRRHGKESSSHQKETLFRHALKSALNSSIYRIVITFRKHINGLHLPEEYRRHMKQYLDFKA